jgi:transposase
MKIDKQTIFEIHRLDDLGWSERKIARHLRVSRPSVNKYLTNPDLSPVKRAPRPSKLDAYRDLIKEFVEDDPQVKAPVVLQRLQDKGFDGKITIVRDYLQKLRGRQSKRRAFIRFESPPGRQMQSTLEVFLTGRLRESSMPLRPSSATAGWHMSNLPTVKTSSACIRRF